MTDRDLEQLVPAMVDAAIAAGRVTLGYFHGGGAPETLKTDGSPVTVADEEAEDVILERLSVAAPWLQVIAEEAMARGDHTAHADTFALVDPLDGTREFVAGRADFTVNIGVVRDGSPVLGVVYAPAWERIYATIGLGRAAMAAVPAAALPATESAEEAGNREPMAQQLAWSPIATRSFDEAGVTVTMSRSHGSADEEAFLARLPVPVGERRNVGSSLKFALLASGEADLYMRTGPTMEWDTAAGHALLEAAGGAVVGLDGGRFGYGKSGAGYRNPGFIAIASHGLRTRLFPSAG